MRKRVDGAGAKVARQCGNCGGISGHWIALTRVPNWQSLPDWDYGIEPAWQQREREYLPNYRKQKIESEGVAAFAKPEPEPAVGFWEKYGPYLASEAWREKANLVLMRAHGICEGCGKAPATQVHHLTYARVGNEMLFDLVAICKSCHEIIHGRPM